ncbi:serine/threonine-protein kinase [Ruminococcus sp.]|uniref:serine/threonine protein kinase n=1 Tax=Ruminococcus sp. TaxID=41978 RepID=UPI0025EBFF14|nr:serine/threonine-protein kinase [Ruminococcus sp.]MBR1432869.1 protein kinase [Ruminococcus sp.]
MDASKSDNNHKYCINETAYDDRTELSSDTTVFDDNSNFDISGDETALSDDREDIPELSCANDNNDKTYQTIAGYRITEVIGQGGGGTVYKAVHPRLEKNVVLKQIKSSVKGKISLRGEVDVLKNLKHTYLPQVIDFINENDQIYTVMDFVEGTDLKVTIKNNGRLSSKDTVRYAKQLCEAVEYLHSRRPAIIHSDIKPANVMLTPGGDICLIDFNISLVFDSGEKKAIGGTPGFAAPEQLGKLGYAQDSHVDERSDIYGIGATMYYMVTGRTPDKDFATPELSAKNDSIPEGLAFIINKAMSFDPVRRFNSVSSMLSALNGVYKLDRRYKRLKARRIVATVIFLAMSAGFVYLNRLGAAKLVEERQIKYLSYISESEDDILAGDMESADKTADAAVTLIPERIDAYALKARILFEEKKYAECYAYVASNTFPAAQDDETRILSSNMYAYAASSAFELEDYEAAIKLYDSALSLTESNSDLRRDLAISYARLGMAEQAETTLEQAREKGLTDDQLELVSGEICYSEGNYEQAFVYFADAVKMADSDYIKYRAVLICDRMIGENSEFAKVSRPRMINMLLWTEKSISVEYRSVIKEMLAADYSAYSAETGDISGYESAAAIYEELMSSGTLSYMLKKNWFNICFELGRYEKCIEILNSMADGSDDYWIWMNYSYVQIAVQSDLSAENRDYSEAYGNYLKAEKLYSEFRKNGKNDPNMDRLKTLISELKEKGWVE